MSETTNVSVTLGYTLNLGNFQSLRIDLGITDFVRSGENTDQALDRVYEFVENKVIHTLQVTTNQKKAFKTANERRPLFEIHWWGTRLSNDLSFLIPNQN